jgi:glutaredoxin-related protein
MGSILYYSNFCEPSKKLLQYVSKIQVSKDIHFICIDKRIRESNGKIYIILQNEQKIVMPENVTKVPALLLLNQNYKVIYGDDIYNYIKPIQKQEIKQATRNNMEPHSFAFDAFSGFGGGIVSDNYSFLDQNDDELSVKGNGGMRQMHSYVSLNDSMNISMHLPQDDYEYKSDKIKDGQISLESLQKQREQELSGLFDSNRIINIK